MRVGVPQALLFWEYAPLWLKLLGELGAETVVSGETTRGTLDAGVSRAVDEVCLPVKICYGHCVEVARQVDVVFLPRLVAVEPRAYICPKFMGLPDMVGPAVGGTGRLLSPVLDLRRGGSGLAEMAREVARALGAGPRAARRALAVAGRAQAQAEERWEHGDLPPAALRALGYLPGGEAPAARAAGASRPAGGGATRGCLGVMGHPYNVYDRLVSMDLLRRLGDVGWEVATAETVAPADRAEGARQLRKELFWTLGRRVYGAAAHLMQAGRVAGLIYLVSFGCGPDSLVGELVAREAERRGAPFLLLTVDEHTGEAGAWTRVEAFLDMIEWREMRASRPS
jgi:predicted nucleotide-binding protein (sugar kinase/HSP70/actin superfamily)